MVRNSNSNNSGGPEDAALQIASSVLSKQSQYTDDLSRKFHPLACDLASRLHDETGELAQALLSYAADVDESQNAGNATMRTKMAAFLDEQRTRLKRHVVANAKRARDVEAFCGAVGSVRDDIRMKRQNVANAQLDNDDVDDATANDILAKFDIQTGDGVDYEKTILDKMKERTGGGGDGNGNGDDEEDDLQRFQSNAMVRDMMERLGEKVQGAGGAKTTGEDDDDDDLEMVGDAAGHNHGADLKCPITTMYLDRPLKNTRCGHVYSKEGIEQLLRGHGRKKSCPVAGCTNDDVQKNQLVEDVEMAMRVKRYLKKLEREKKAKMSQLDDLDDE